MTRPDRTDRQADCSVPADCEGAPIGVPEPASAQSTVAFFHEHVQAALGHHQAGRLAEAQALYREILKAEPEHADALHFLGLLLCDTGERDIGLAMMARSIRLQPNAIYFNNHGNVLGRQGDRASAIECYRQAILLRPDYAEAHNNLGHALCEDGDWTAAIQSCAQALALKPDYPEAWNNLGNALKGSGNWDAAIKSYAKALALNPWYAQAHNNLGNMFEKLNRLEHAIACYRQAIVLEPGVATIRSNLGNVLRDAVLLDEAVECLHKAVECDPAWPEVHSNLLVTLNFLPQCTPQELLDESRRLGARLSAAVTPYRHEPDASARDPNRRLRVGLVSGDFASHPVGYFLEDVLAHLDAARIELIAYPTRTHEDTVTSRLKPYFAAWSGLSTLNDEQAARKIHNDNIDVLVDLSGHTSHNRLALFARKPSPIQVSWLGYFATTGLSAMDYILGDRHVLPDDEREHFIEEPWCLPDSYLCFTPPTQDIPVGPMPVTATGTFTFGCFNHLAKLNESVISLWSRVLHAVPDSRLFLKTKQLGDPDVQRRMLERFVAYGIDAARLALEGASPRAELLASYNRVDIALDPFPYPGGTTTIEALWMGVPVLTRRGDRFLSHVGESILHTAGLEDWIAADSHAYVAKAAAFASVHDRLARLRSQLRPQILASPLCDAPRFANHLEHAFRGMWERYARCAGETTK